jgi:CheY-like chemotaxis protein
MAYDGEAGRELAGQLHPAGIVLDILMPKLDGWDLLTRAKAGGTEGIALARQEQSAIILLGLLMSEVDGFEVVERLRAEPETARIPIVILTSQTMTRAEKERLNGQISFLAQKAEFKRADLLELVRNFAQTQST